jgi:hypothetical protein
VRLGSKLEEMRSLLGECPAENLIVVTNPLSVKEKSRHFMYLLGLISEYLMRKNNSPDGLQGILHIVFGQVVNRCAASSKLMDLT